MVKQALEAVQYVDGKAALNIKETADGFDITDTEEGIFHHWKLLRVVVIAEAFDFSCYIDFDRKVLRVY